MKYSTRSFWIKYPTFSRIQFLVCPGSHLPIWEIDKRLDRFVCIHISIIIWMSHSIGNGNTWMNIIQIFSHKNKWNQTNKKLSLFHFIHYRQSATQTFDIKMFNSLSVISPCIFHHVRATFKQIMRRQLYSKFSSQRCISNPHLTGVVNGDVYLHFLSQPLL